MKDQTETICALSTPPGRSGIAVVRISGRESMRLLNRIFSPYRKYDEFPFRRAILGRIEDPISGCEIDEAIAVFYKAPNSYTGEDMVELSLHGSPILVSTLLTCLCSIGARLADPGEFTMRAFLNGRLDLAQAEAINDVINSSTLLQAQVAGRQRSGMLAQQMKPVKEELIHIIVNLETAIEFAEEHLAFETGERLIQQIRGIGQQLKDWMDTYRRGKIIREGFRLAIVGRPNVGKSSLFNALLAQERSIVTEIPGTTRDLVSEFTNLEGIPVRLVDTAGIQLTEDYVEKLGVARSYQAIADADAILFVVDASRSPSSQDFDLRQHLSDLSCLVIFNKSDLGISWSNEERCSFAGQWPNIEVSAKTKSGIGELRDDIINKVLGSTGMERESILITNVRHLHKIDEAKSEIYSAAESLQSGLSEEFALMNLRNGLKHLGAITGETDVEDLLGEIFSHFCIGK
jgi:tRNA modification GTPase